MSFQCFSDIRHFLYSKLYITLLFLSYAWEAKVNHAVSNATIPAPDSNVLAWLKNHAIPLMRSVNSKVQLKFQYFKNVDTVFIVNGSLVVFMQLKFQEDDLPLVLLSPASSALLLYAIEALKMNSVLPLGTPVQLNSFPATPFFQLLRHVTLLKQLNFFLVILLFLLRTHLLMYTSLYLPSRKKTLLTKYQILFLLKKKQIDRALLDDLAILQLKSHELFYGLTINRIKNIN